MSTLDTMEGYFSCDGLRVAYRYHQTSVDADTVVFLHGFGSSMESTKGKLIFDFCVDIGLNALLFDNLGHGKSDGNFVDCTMSMWLETARRLLQEFTPRPPLLVGSSKGGWLALLLARIIPIKALLLLAPAQDFPTYFLDALPKETQEGLLHTPGFVFNINSSGYLIPLSHAFVQDSFSHMLMKSDSVDVTCPVAIVHGMLDKSVDYRQSILLQEKLASRDVCLKLLKNSYHALSLPNEFAIIANSIKELLNLSI